MEDERFIENLILEKQKDPFHKLKCNPVLNLLINGVCDEQCSLSLLIGAPHILYTIWNHIETYWRQMIIKGVGFAEDPKEWFLANDSKDVAFHAISNSGFVRDYYFPRPKDICINMMPFVMEKTFEKCKLPEYLKPYWDVIINKDYDNYYGNKYDYRKLIPDSEYGKIGFLTIHESFVKKNETQRRPGLHTDCHGKVMIVPNKDGDSVSLGRVSQEEESEIGNIIVSSRGEGFCFQQIMGGFDLYWSKPEIYGGIFMMSDVPDSCLVYNCIIDPDEEGNEIIGKLGDVEHLSDILPSYGCETMKPNAMYWITDRTPHMDLPLKEDAYRQYFCLVTSEVSLWYEEHSTKNPLGVVPDPEVTTIVKGSKLERN